MSFIRGTHSKMRICCLIAAAATVLAVTGCVDRPTAPIPLAQVKLGFSLQSSELASLVHSVTLTIQYPDTVIVQTLTLVDGAIHDTLAVQPAAAIVFTLRAFDASGNLLYIGSATRGVEPGQRVEVAILMIPNPEFLMLRAGPIFQSPALGTAELVPINVDVYNVDSLAGAAFRIQYDTLRLRFSHATEGGFITGTPPWETIAFAIDTLDFVACSVARVGQANVQAPGVSGSGRLMTFYFTKQAAGTSAVTIVRQTVSLQKPGGRFVNGFSGLVLESATVEIK